MPSLISADKGLTEFWLAVLLVMNQALTMEVLCSTGTTIPLIPRPSSVTIPISVCSGLRPGSEAVANGHLQSL